MNEETTPPEEVQQDELQKPIERASKAVKNLLNTNSRHEMRKMMAMIRKKPKRGNTKPLFNKAKRKIRNEMQAASRRANIIHQQKLKARV